MKRPYGRVNLVGLLMIAAVVGGLYMVIMLSPVYADNFDVQEAVSMAFNQMGTKSDDQLREIIRSKLHYVGTHQEYNQFGNLEQVQGLGLADEQILVERDNVRNTGGIQVNYEREVVLKPFGKVMRIQFHPSKSGPIPR